MQPGKKWIASKNKSVHKTPKGQMGFKPQANQKCTPNLQTIRASLIFAVKHDGRHKARLVADGPLTPEPVENIYSGIVSLRHLRLVIFLGELSNLELCLHP